MCIKTSAKQHANFIVLLDPSALCVFREIKQLRPKCKRTLKTSMSPSNFKLHWPYSGEMVAPSCFYEDYPFSRFLAELEATSQVEKIAIPDTQVHRLDVPRENRKMNEVEKGCRMSAMTERIQCMNKTNVYTKAGHLSVSLFSVDHWSGHSLALKSNISASLMVSDPYSLFVKYPYVSAICCNIMKTNVLSGYCTLRNVWANTQISAEFARRDDLQDYFFKNALTLYSSTVVFTRGPGGLQGMLVFVFTSISATKSDTRNQVRWDTCVNNCFKWSAE